MLTADGRTVFGEHTIRAYMYAAGAHQVIGLRPIDARLSLPPGCCSYFLEEFSQYFCVDRAFGQASRGLATVLRQKVSVNTLEHINFADVELHGRNRLSC